jgi:hypothetical protein
MGTWPKQFFEKCSLGFSIFTSTANKGGLTFSFPIACLLFISAFDSVHWLGLPSSMIWNINGENENPLFLILGGSHSSLTIMLAVGFFFFFGEGL